MTDSRRRARWLIAGALLTLLVAADQILLRRLTETDSRGLMEATFGPAAVRTATEEYGSAARAIENIVESRTADGTIRMSNLPCYPDTARARAGWEDLYRLQWMRRIPFARVPVPAQDLPTIRINADGFRGREIRTVKRPGTIRVVLLGNSTAFGVGASDDAATIAQRLEVHLSAAVGAPVEVVNLAVPRFTTDEERTVWFEVGQHLSPDAVVHLTGFQDAADLLSPPEDPETLEARETFAKRWARRSGLASLLWGAPNDVTDRAAWKSPLAIVPSSTPSGPFEENEDTEAVQGGLERTARNLRATALSSTDLGAVWIVAIQPTLARQPYLFQYERDVIWKTQNPAAGVEQERVRTIFRAAGARQIEAITRVGKARAMPAVVIDLNDLFPANPQPLFCDFVHLGDAGQDYFAGVLAKAIASLLQARGR